MIELVFATNNAHKLEEVRAVVGDKFSIRTLADLGCTDDIPETGDTFEANAAQKSTYLYERYGCDCFADDSGLEVTALGNEPGVYSARYSGTRDMEKNIDLLLQRLGDQPDRSARFRTVISLRIGDREHFFEGVVEGTIGYERRGDGGFGYDPLFTPVGYQKTFAQMTPAEKNAISHRAIAVAKLADFLKANY
ncbi:RdgB/HAM1 family non-canonical purine NTP pyrophosphatase [Parapedobacter sp. 10938]|uniref:RdgB/HAM1 family non-canonical purine NTP pyrophosphatase n=1 Tax=Parapedobacter flavus TaxID=3110225 RepID=UPI002DBF3BA1|nr:RdgB/HAM1 family non-canonical purine NTP pyrophosphatase [Parapedobacter sp. 10938]MEC3878904.1 RdgB/HAM1 family non-canonical purine NTP pyrophosphatase [Parapedobacter sp. 10938]